VGGGSIIANSTGYFAGVSSITSLVWGLGANVVVNTSGYGIGNSTVSVIANSTQIAVGNTVVNNQSVKVGNSTVFSTMNSTTYSGVALTANNSAYLGGVIASQYAYANQITSSSPGGSNTYLQFNSSGVFGGTIGLSWNFNSNTMSVSNAISLVVQAVLLLVQTIRVRLRLPTSATSATSATNASKPFWSGSAYTCRSVTSAVLYSPVRCRRVSITSVIS